MYENKSQHVHEKHRQLSGPMYCVGGIPTAYSVPPVVFKQGKRRDPSHQKTFLNEVIELFLSWWENYWDIYEVIIYHNEKRNLKENKAYYLP